MSALTSIEWTDRTWNPVRGCRMAKGSETKGCLNCYAAALAARNLPGMRSPTTGQPFARRTKNGPRWTGDVELIPSKLDEPLRWRKPQRVFVNSMSDLFHEALPFEQIAAVYGVMACAPHTFQVLTKRPRRRLEFHAWLAERIAASRSVFPHDPDRWVARHLVTNRARHFGAAGSVQASGEAWPLPNVWEGVSVEDQATADERILLLLQTPAAVRFVSYEPALGAVDFGLDCLEKEPGWEPPFILHNRDAMHPCDYACGTTEVLGGIDWIIVGGESGPGARPFDVEWARSTVRQCKAAGVTVFVKQLGAIAHDGYTGRPGSGDPCGCRSVDECFHGTFPVLNAIPLTDRKGGDPSEWPEDLRVREFPV